MKRQEHIPEGLQFQKWSKKILSAFESSTGANDLSGREPAQVLFTCLNLSVKRFSDLLRMFGALDEAHSVVVERCGRRVTGRQGSSLWGRLELARSELLEGSSSGELDQIYKM